jgi:hypothetical protein
MRRLMIGLVLMAGTIGASNTYAWECPKHLAAAEAAISEASQALGAAKGKPNSALAHTLRDDANMLLSSAKHNHEKPAAGAYDHARSIAKAKSAKAYAETATELASR